MNDQCFTFYSRTLHRSTGPMYIFRCGNDHAHCLKTKFVLYHKFFCLICSHQTSNYHTFNMHSGIEQMFPALIMSCEIVCNLCVGIGIFFCLQYVCVFVCVYCVHLDCMCFPGSSSFKVWWKPQTPVCYILFHIIIYSMYFRLCSLSVVPIIFLYYNFAATCTVPEYYRIHYKVQSSVIKCWI